MKRNDIVEFLKEELVHSGDAVIHVVKNGDKGRVLGVDNGIATISLWQTVHWISLPEDYEHVVVDQ